MNHSLQLASGRLVKQKKLPSTLKYSRNVQFTSALSDTKDVVGCCSHYQHISFAYLLPPFSFNQVHRAVLKDGSDVVMKIQYPGVADSIESDIENVRLLLTYTNLIPKGLFLDRAMKVNLFISYVSRDMDGSPFLFIVFLPAVLARFCKWAEL